MEKRRAQPYRRINPAGAQRVELTGKQENLVDGEGRGTGRLAWSSSQCQRE